MNYSLINNYKNEDFVKIKNNSYNPFQNNTKDNWSTEGSIQKSLLVGTYSPTPLGELFLSRDNMNRIQNKIKKEVYIRTKGKYVLNVSQNESDLLIVMRAVYISDAMHEPYRLVHQVKILNHLTIERIVPDMISMIKQDEKYLFDISHPINPIPLPVNINRAGTRSLPSMTTTFNLK
jgi:hypothetical protein